MKWNRLSFIKCGSIALHLILVLIILYGNLSSIYFESRLLIYSFISILCCIAGAALLITIYPGNKTEYIYIGSSLGAVMAFVLLFSFAHLNSSLRSFSKLASFILIESIFDSNIIKAIVNEVPTVWLLALIFYIGIFLLLWGFKIKKKNPIGEAVIKKLLILGMGLGCILNVLCFATTHIPFLWSNINYAQASLSHIDQIVSIYESKNQTNHFVIKNLKYFKSVSEASRFYSESTESDIFKISDEKQEFYSECLNALFSVDQSGWSSQSHLNFKSIRYFKDWVQFLGNFRMTGSDELQKKLWITSVLTVNPNKTSVKNQDHTNIGIFYFHETDNGVYSIIELNNDMYIKGTGQRFLWLFILFNFVYFSLFLILIRFHMSKFGLVKNNAT